jgi:anti-sigma B factor antagonist
VALDWCALAAVASGCVGLAGARADPTRAAHVTDSVETGEGVGSQFWVVVTAGAGGTVVLPHGELDLATAADLEAVLVAQTGRVVVDLRGLSFVDASGLRVLLEAQARSRQDGMALRFVAGEAVRRLFQHAAVPDPLTYIEPPVA